MTTFPSQLGQSRHCLWMCNLPGSFENRTKHGKKIFLNRFIGSHWSGNMFVVKINMCVVDFAWIERFSSAICGTKYCKYWSERLARLARSVQLIGCLQARINGHILSPINENLHCSKITKTNNSPTCHPSFCFVFLTNWRCWIDEWYSKWTGSYIAPYISIEHSHTYIL